MQRVVVNFLQRDVVDEQRWQGQVLGLAQYSQTNEASDSDATQLHQTVWSVYPVLQDDHAIFFSNRSTVHTKQT